ncbi:MAG: bactofilin family protein [Gammaproteobacteria bacterium]
MFELGKKEGSSAQAHDFSSQEPQPARTASQSDHSNVSRRSGSSQVAVIGRSIQINGDVEGDEDLLIEGDVSGTVELKNNSLTVGKEGKVRANVYARSITVDGTTEGDLYASERIAIRASAEIRGNLLAPRIAIDDGARFKGSIEMDPQAVEKELGTKVSSQPSKPAQQQRADSSPAKANSDSKPVTGQANAVGAAS